MIMQCPFKKAKYECAICVRACMCVCERESFITIHVEFIYMLLIHPWYLQIMGT